MALEKHITTREFVRNLKKYKEMLLSGKVMHLVISLDDGEALEVKRRHKGLTGKELAERIRSMKKPIHIERPVGFLDDIVERAERRRYGEQH